MKPKSSSVSQNNTYQDCARKWGFSSISYLPQEPNRSTSRGSAMHDQLEIYLDVDENGLSRRTGKEPEMYPKGWEIQKDYFGKKVLFVLDSEEQNMIKKAIKMGIEQSVVVREPGAVVEFEKRIPINDYLYFTLKIDYAYGFNIEDHKSCTNFNYSTVADKNHDRYIGKDVQLKCYAYWWAQEYSKMSGEPIPEEISICHNQFMIDPRKGKPVVRKVEGKVTFAECEATWNDVYKTALEQLDYRLKVHSGEMKVAQIPRDISACGKYRGCPYKSVCMGMESPAMYKKRVELKIEELTLLIQKKDEDMGFNMADGATSEQAKVLEELEKGTETVAPKEETVAPKEETTAPVESNKSDEELVKEYKAEIKAIEDKLKAAGMENYIKGSPDIAAVKEKLKPVEDREKKRKAEERAQKKAEKEAKEKAEAEAKAKEKAEFDALSDEEKTAQIDAKLEKAEAKTKKVDKEFAIETLTKSRDKGITVLIDCYLVGGVPCNTISIQEIFGLKSAQLAKEAGASSYWELDPFKRKDAFRAAKDNILSELKGYTILACGYSHEEQALLNAIMEDRNVRVISGR